MSQRSAMCPKDLQRAPWWLSWQRARLQCRRPQLNSWVGKTPWRREWLPTPIFLGFPGGSAGKESACNAGDPSSIPGSGRPPGEGNGYPLQYSWASLVAQLVKNLPAMQETWVWSLGWKDPLEKGTATLSSILAWRIPWTVESIGLQRVGNDWVTFTFIFKDPQKVPNWPSPGAATTADSWHHCCWIRGKGSLKSISDFKWNQLYLRPQDLPVPRRWGWRCCVS